MSSAVVLGVGVIAFFFLAFGSLIDKKEHGFMRNFLFILAFCLLIIIAPSLILDQTVCSIIVSDDVTDYTYGYNLSDNWDNNSGVAPALASDVYLLETNTSYSYDNFCFEKNNGSVALHKAMMVIFIIFIIYLGFMNLKQLYLYAKEAFRKI